MKNFVKEGRALDFVAPAGGVLSGIALLIGGILVVPATSALEGQSYSGWIVGVYTLPCAPGTAWNTCDTLYWDTANARVTTVAVGNTKIGMAAEPKAAGDTAGNVKLLPQV
ncbi:DUF2190 family protein [Sphingomonas sp. CROZ-RG-20F-R02-07]|uniref:DUF2190 family protein n=1 Tax=Sphingomonas sp. CROZ-RG-20F-R02-07 TaxID=2914832 RepID=UPI001F5AACDF|nr:DUF2190 family protein [Sphingomonas sp. CROZ-RG-20F-R02-07]